MTRPISPALQNHMAGEVTTLATCWHITLTDGTIMGFTNHDKNIVFSGLTYIADPGITTSTNKSNSDMSVDNMELDSFLESAYITEGDINNCLYDYASVQVFLVNYNDLTMGNLIIRTGTIGEITIDNEKLTAEIRGLTQNLAQLEGRIITPLCDAQLGDSRCTVNLTPFTFAAIVTGITNNQIFLASALTQTSAYFAGGVVTWTGGSNNGLSIEVQTFINTQVSLVLPMGYDIQLGDTFSIVTGCDKTKGTCQSKFSNLVNFRGFPDVPGMNAILTTSGTLQST